MLASSRGTSGKWAAFVVNRRMDAAEPVELTLRGLNDKAVQVRQLSGSDPKAHNTFENPNAVVPTNLGAQPVTDGKLSLLLPPMSFTVIEG